MCRLINQSKDPINISIVGAAHLYGMMVENKLSDECIVLGINASYESEDFRDDYIAKCEAFLSSDAVYQFSNFGDYQKLEAAVNYFHYLMTLSNTHKPSLMNFIQKKLFVLSFNLRRLKPQ